MAIPDITATGPAMGTITMIMADQAIIADRI